MLGAPFFKREDKIERSHSEAHKTGTKKEHSRRAEKEKWFNFSFFLPDQDTFSNENSENDYCRTEAEALWRPEEEEGTPKSTKKYFQNSPSAKSKIAKRNR